MAFSATGMMTAGLGRIEASITGESALIDRDSGRVYWEGRSSNTLYESLAPKLDQFGAEHAQATLLTLAITLAFLGVLAAWLQRAIDSFYQLGGAPSLPGSSSYFRSQVVSILVTAAECTILKGPRIRNKWLVVASVVLYFLECYNCSTRRFLTNAFSSSDDVDAYIESLRQEQPIVTWKVKAFHYEIRRIFTLARFLRSLTRKLKGSVALESPFEASFQTEANPSFINQRLHTNPMFPFTRKVITNEATTVYHYASCTDDTMAGVWTRAQASGSRDPVAPFTKIALNKLLVLADRRSREDYFRQQSDFVTRHGRGDEFVEFSTDIEVAGYRPRLLAIRKQSSSASWHKKDKERSGQFYLHLFWVCSICGFTVPYRIWFKRHCDFVRVTVVKETSAVSSSGASLASSYWEAAKSWLPSISSSSQTSIPQSKGVGEAVFGSVPIDSARSLNAESHENDKTSTAIQNATAHSAEKQPQPSAAIPIPTLKVKQPWSNDNEPFIATVNSQDNSNDERSSESTTSLVKDPGTHD